MSEYNDNTDHVGILRAAYKRMDMARDEWIEATLDYAFLLLAARRAQPSDRAFGQWLAANELDHVSRDDRAALLNIAEHPDLYRECATESGRRSSRLLWIEEMLPRCRSAAIPDVISESSAPEADSPSGAPVEVAKSETISAATLARSPLRHLPDFERVLQHVQHPSTRTMLAALMKKKLGRALWELLVQSIQSGAYGPPSSASVSRPNLRLLLPWASAGYAQRFDLLTREDLRAVREQILPIVLAHRARLTREPEQLQSLLAEDSRAKREAAREADQTKLLEAQAARHAVAVAALPATEQAVILYGTPFWPPPRGTALWSYDELLQAAWFFHAMVPLVESADLGARKRGHQAQGTMQWINVLMKFLPWRRTPFCEAVRQIGLAYEKAPDVRCQLPPAPTNYGLSE